MSNASVFVGWQDTQFLSWFQAQGITVLLWFSDKIAFLFWKQILADVVARSHVREV